MHTSNDRERRNRIALKSISKMSGRELRLELAEARVALVRIQDTLADKKTVSSEWLNSVTERWKKTSEYRGVHDA